MDTANEKNLIKIYIMFSNKDISRAIEQEKAIERESERERERGM